MKFVFVFALLSCALLTLQAERQPFDRYQSIVDRQMFGAVPPGFDPTKLPSEVTKTTDEKQLTQDQQKLQSAIHFSVLNVDGNGDVYVGFTDQSDPKVPRNYFMKVGDTRDGWTVKEADRDTAKMTIEKNEIEVTLTLGGNSAKDAGATAKAGGAPADAMTTRERPTSLANGSSLLGRRQKRLRLQQEEKTRQEEREAAAAAKEAEREARAAEEKEKLEAERAEQRQQLQALREEIRRAREAKATEKEQHETDAN